MVHCLQQVTLCMRRELAEGAARAGAAAIRSQQRRHPDQRPLGVLLPLQQQRRDDVVDAIPRGNRQHLQHNATVRDDDADG